MVALKGKAIASFLARRDKDINAVLVYGPDAGLARERAERLAKSVVDDFKDPFNYIELTDADLKAEPARLSDEAVALSFTGGERVIRLRTTGDSAAAPAAALLKALDAGHLKPNALVVIEAGELSPRSKLRKAFETAKRGAALPCYADAPADIRGVAIEAARAEDLSFEDDALDLLLGALGDDRGVSRAEIDKLILFKGPKSLRSGPGVISLEDVRACIVDGFGDALNDAAAACADGATKRVEAALYKAAAAGASPIAILRAVQRRAARLTAAHDLMAGGESAAGAMKRLKPPVFFAEQRQFETQLRRWTPARLDHAVRILTDAELEAKTTGAPQREIVERAAMRMSMMAQR